SPVAPDARLETRWTVEGSSDCRLPAVVTATSAWGRGEVAVGRGRVRMSLDAVPVGGAWRVRMPVGEVMAPLGGRTAFAHPVASKPATRPPSRARLARVGRPDGSSRLMRMAPAYAA